VPAAASNPSTLLVGQPLANGRYTIQRPLSKGGMGAIYLATDHEAFDRTVVVKAMLDYFDPSDPQAAQVAQDIFVREARTLSELRHPAIPQIYTYFQAGSHNYIVMEYIEGRDLEKELTHYDTTTAMIVTGQPYPQEDVIRWGVALCKVLEYLAGRNPLPVVHHDIKPANLILDRNSNEIRLVDFGTARARLMLQQAGNAGVQKSSAYGTQGYAPPEQYNGKSEPRSDVYALAATLYHLATDDDPGLHPFQFPRLTDLSELGKLLEVALDEKVEKRPSAAALRQQLEALLAAPASVRPIQTPDGQSLSTVPELVVWCEQHWDRAAKWLYRSMPDMIEHLWLQPDLSDQLRALVSSNRGNQKAGLDEALAYLDPQGFGTKRVQVSVDRPLVNFGNLAINENRNQSVTLTNSGERFVRLRFDAPNWVTVKPATVSLMPGKKASVTLATNTEKIPSGKSQDSIAIRRGSKKLAHVRVRINLSYWRTIGQMFTRARSAQRFFLAALLPMVIGWVVAMALLMREGAIRSPTVPIALFFIIVLVAVLVRGVVSRRRE
jgi:serine/threonine protein kinase